MRSLYSLPVLATGALAVWYIGFVNREYFEY